MRALLLSLMPGSAPAFAADRLVQVDTRPGASISYWWMERAEATLRCC